MSACIRIGRYSVLSPQSSVLLLLSVLLSGCTAAGVLAYKLAGPTPVDAKYTPAKTPLLILVENHRQPSMTVGPDVLTGYLAEQLTDNKVAPLVPTEKLQALRDAKPEEYKTMSISAIGKAVGASQVLYVQFNVDDVTQLAGGDSLQGKTDVVVKMIDVASGKTLWPDTSEGYGVGSSSSLGTESSQGTPVEVHRRMYTILADKIAKLFYRWQPEDDTPESFEKG
jgi:hypothetical protein